MSGLYRWVFIAGRAAALASAAPAPEPVPGHGDTSGNRTAAVATFGCAGTPRNIQADRRSMKKNFVGMTLAPFTVAVFCFFRAFRSLYRRLLACPFCLSPSDWRDPFWALHTP